MIGLVLRDQSVDIGSSIPGKIPNCLALATASVRFLASSFPMMLEMCPLTVLNEIYNRSADLSIGASLSEQLQDLQFALAERLYQSGIAFA